MFSSKQHYMLLSHWQRRCSASRCVLINKYEGISGQRDMFFHAAVAYPAMFDANGQKQRSFLIVSKCLITKERFSVCNYGVRFDVITLTFCFADGWEVITIRFQLFCQNLMGNNFTSYYID